MILNMKKSHFRYSKILLVNIFIACFCCISANAQKNITMSFGTGCVITYNAKEHTYNVTDNNKVILAGASGLVVVNGTALPLSDYPAPKLTTTTFSDGIGSGTKYALAYTAAGKPDLTQTFYTYKDKQYFITQVEVDGTGAQISTNYMAPLTTGKIAFDAAKNLHTVFMPYDNDAFISYESKPLEKTASNTSAEVGLVFNNTSRNGVIIGSLEHTVWKSAVKTTNTNNSVALTAWAGFSEQAVTRDAIPHGMVKGSKVLSPKFFVGYYADWRTGLEEYGKANRLTEKPFVFNWDKPTPVGWNSWGVLMEKINYDNTTKVADFFADSIPQFRVGNTAYIDLDSFWDNMVKGGFSGDFAKVKEFADYCKKKGLEPGVYWAPFTDWGHKDGPDRKAEGGNYTYGEMWTKTGDDTYFDFDGARAIDPTHPGTLQRVDYVLNKLKACGFKMIKIDFLGHAAAESTSFYDKNVTTGMQAYRVGMERLVKALDGQMLIYAAISPNLATSRYAHTRRIACDAWKTIEQTQYTLNSVNFGWWQTYTYNYIDADHVVFADESEGENRARLISAVITGTLITGDDYSKAGPWTERAKAWLGNKEMLEIVANGRAFRPVEGNMGSKTSETFVQKIDNNFYLAVFNYGKDKKQYSLDLKRLGIKEGSYSLVDIFSAESKLIKGNTIDLTLGAEDGHLYKIIKP